MTYVTPHLQQGGASPALGPGCGRTKGFSPQLLGIQQHNSAPERIGAVFQITFLTNAPLVGRCFSRLHPSPLIPLEPVQCWRSSTRDVRLWYPPGRSPELDLLFPFGISRTDQFSQGRERGLKHDSSPETPHEIRPHKGLVHSQEQPGITRSSSSQTAKFRWFSLASHV